MNILTKVSRKVKGFLMPRRAKTKKILERIDVCGLKQKWLAEQIGYHPVTLNKIIQGKDGKLNPQKSHALAELLGVSVDVIQDLFGI